MARIFQFSCDACDQTQSSATSDLPNGFADITITIDGYTNPYLCFDGRQSKTMLLCGGCQLALYATIVNPSLWRDGAAKQAVSAAQTTEPAAAAVGPATPEPEPPVLTALEQQAAPAASPPPAAATPDPGLPKLTLNQEKVYDHLCLCAVKTESETVTIDLPVLADKAGVARGNIHYLLSELQRKRLIDWKKSGMAGSPTFTVFGALDGIEAAQ